MTSRPGKRFILVAQAFHGVSADQAARSLGMGRDRVSAIRHAAHRGLRRIAGPCNCLR